MKKKIKIGVIVSLALLVFLFINKLSSTGVREQANVGEVEQANMGEIEQGGFNNWTADNFMKVPELKEEIENNDICVVAEVTKGTEESGIYSVSGRALFGDTEEDEVLYEQLSSQGMIPEQVEYGQYDIKVEKYIYDKTEEYQENLTVIYGLMVQHMGIKAETGMKLVLFLSPADNFEGKYYGAINWAYYVQEDGSIIPVNDEEKQKEYKEKKVEKYLEKIQKLYEKSIRD